LPHLFFPGELFLEFPGQAIGDIERHETLCVGPDLLGDSSDAEYRRLLGDLRGKEGELEKLESGIAAAETALEKLEEKKAAALDEKESLEAQFKASGGLRKDERDILHNQLRRYDQEKEECAIS